MIRIGASMLALALVAFGSISSAPDVWAAERLLQADSRQDIRVKAPSPLTVDSRDLVLTDAKRGKDLAIKVSFPKQPGKYPVIIYSHGAGGSKDNYQPLITHWVSHGYVCIQPTHSDSLSLLRRQPGSTNELAGRSTFRQRDGLRSLLGGQTFRDWPNRPLDVSFLIENLSTIDESVPQLKGKMNMNAIGVGGHSFGAHTTQLIGGTRIGGTNKYSDSRPLAFLLISPQGREEGFDGGSRLDAESWSGFTRPMMVITGTNDKGRGQQPYEWRKDPFTFSPKGDKYLLVIDGAYHHFGGIAGIQRATWNGPADPNQVSLVQQSSLLFWDAYLKRDAAAAQTLKSEHVPKTEWIRYQLSAK